ncbi:MAG: FAD-binding oxidoreductase [Pirellulaceae bacterium]|nr:FAD-binding oxidoreductase [Pirellulaceae bacterium]
MPKISVIGGGIIALSTATVAAELGHQIDLRFTADHSCLGKEPEEAFLEQSLKTASGAAAAFWTPFSVGTYRKRWAIESLERYRALAGCEERSKTGIYLGNLNLLFSKEKEAEKSLESELWWTKLPSTWPDKQTGIRVEKLDEPVVVGEHEMPFSVRAVVPVIDMSVYLPYLVRYAQMLNVQFTPSPTTVKPSDIEDKYDGIVLCGGHDSSNVLHKGDDQPVIPLVGHLVAASLSEGSKNRFVDDIILAHSSDVSRPAYIVRTVNHPVVLLGGTVFKTKSPAIENSLPLNDLENQRIIEECSQIAGNLTPIKSATGLQTREGLRPYRSSVRLETCSISDKSKTPFVVNYGHGGAGISLAWGCASSALEMLESTIGLESSSDDMVDPDFIKSMPINDP